MGEGGNPRDNLIFDILFDTGLRLGELTALNVGDVAGKDYLTVVGKGSKERTIPIGAGDGLRDKIETTSIYVDPDMDQSGNALIQFPQASS